MRHYVSLVCRYRDFLTLMAQKLFGSAYIYRSCIVTIMSTEQTYHRQWQCHTSQPRPHNVDNYDDPSRCWHILRWNSPCPDRSGHPAIFDQFHSHTCSASASQCVCRNHIIYRFCNVNWCILIFSARQHAERTICYRKSVGPSVCPSVCHTGGSVENGWS